MTRSEAENDARIERDLMLPIAEAPATVEVATTYPCEDPECHMPRPHGHARSRAIDDGVAGPWGPWQYAPGRAGVMQFPTNVEEIPWGDAPAPAVATATPRRCRHPKERRTHVEGGGWRCACGHEVSRERLRAGRSSRNIGKRRELDDARTLGLEPRGTSRDPEDAGGALDPVVAQSKTGGYYPTKIARELELLAPVAAGRPRLVVTTDKPGQSSGRAARPIVSMYRDEFVALTGLDARRRALEAVAEAAIRLLEDGTGSPNMWEELTAAVDELAGTASRTRRTNR